MPKRKDKKSEDPKPSTSGSLKENSRPRAVRTCTKPKKKIPQTVDSSSDDDFEPCPPKVLKSVTVEPKKSTKKTATKKTSTATNKKAVKVDSNANFTPINNVPKERNILMALNSFQNGVKCRSTSYGLEHCARSVIVNQLQNFEVFKSVTPFDRRVTAIAWHPKRPNYCAVGSKGGEIILWRYEKDDFEGIAEGIGPGGSIQKILFDGNHDTRVYTCSIDGTFEVKDLSRTGPTQKSTFLNTQNWDKWYTSFDIAPDNMTIITGENSGYVTLLSSNGEKMWRDKLHKSKVTNIQYSPREPWLFVTTSTDNSVKIWDIRNLTDSDDLTKPRKDKFLQSLEHEKAVNSAYFSNVDGTRLLTTDQHSQIRVYKGPFWDLERILPHPHRQFQHLTPIRSTWHPLVDLVIAGRYPDEKFPGYVPGELRTIDVMNPDSGNMECQISQPGLNKISSLNLFSPDGNAMLSGMGQTVLIWKPKPKEEVKYEERKSNVKDIVVEEWPGYKPSKKPAKKTAKKTKKVD